MKFLPNIGISFIEIDSNTGILIQDPSEIVQRDIWMIVYSILDKFSMCHISSPISYSLLLVLPPWRVEYISYQIMLAHRGHTDHSRV